MYILASNMWFQVLMRQLFFSIDRIVYNFISTIYDLLITIARTSVLTQADIIDMSSRIYRLLTIFMVFKVTFSLIMYVVNPDDFSDKSKGISKLGTNIIFSILVLILTPYIFNYAYQFQTIILNDNSLATLIFGGNSEDEDFFNSAGDKMAYITMSPFFTPNVSLTELRECVSLVEKTDGGNSTMNAECVSGLKSLDSSSNQTVTNNYIAGVEHGNLGLMFRQDMAIAKANDNEFIMDYKYLFSTAVGVVIVLLLLTFCMDVAVRSIKLAFLQLVAPIPIISYVDPKSGKDGLFKKWYQMCIKTYLSLFIRLIALYFAVYIISRVADMRLVDIVDGSYVTNGLIAIFIIIGALMFAKQLPKMLEGLGIKLDGDGKFTLNPIKKFENEALGGKRFTGMAGAMVASMPDRVARVATAPGGWNKFKAIAGAPLGLAGSAVRGFSSNGGFIAGRDRQSEVNRRLREGRINGLSTTRSYLDYVGSKFGMDDATLEREATLTHRNRNAIDQAKREIDDATRGYTQEVKDLNQQNATRKTTRARLDNVKKQGSRLQSMAEDFASKKADLGVSDEDADLVSYLKAHKGEASTRDTSRITDKAFDHSEGARIDDKMIAAAERWANRRQYTSNRKANDANITFLNQHQGETLTRTFTIGDEVFEAGEVIDGRMIAKAEAAKGKYIKASQKEVYEELAKGKDSEYHDGAEADVMAFDNAAKEYDRAVDDANIAIDEYNSEYETEKDLSRISTGHTDYVSLKGVVNDMDTGDASVQINDHISEVEREVDIRNRKIEEIKQQKKVTYYDEDNVRHDDETVDSADSKNKAREDKVKREKQEHDLRRQFRRNVGMFGPPGGGKK